MLYDLVKTIQEQHKEVTTEYKKSRDEIRDEQKKMWDVINSERKNVHRINASLDKLSDDLRAAVVSLGSAIGELKTHLIRTGKSGDIHLLERLSGVGK
jgi:uncharacterized coiled-coil DUF342 family protein